MCIDCRLFAVAILADRLQQKEDRPLKVVPEWKAPVLDLLGFLLAEVAQSDEKALDSDASVLRIMNRIDAEHRDTVWHLRDLLETQVTFMESLRDTLTQNLIHRAERGDEELKQFLHEKPDAIPPAVQAMVDGLGLGGAVVVVKSPQRPSDFGAPPKGGAILN